MIKHYFWWYFSIRDWLHIPRRKVIWVELPAPLREPHRQASVWLGMQKSNSNRSL